MARPTIKEVAEQAGVSTATVSRVLNGHKWVGAETREKVLMAMLELRYQPNRQAQNLAGKRGTKDIIGVYMANSTNSLFQDHIFSEIVRGIGDIAEKEGKSLLLHLGKTEQVNNIPKGLSASMVDGLIIGGTAITKDFGSLLTSQNIPAVVIGKQPWATHRILVDNYQGGKRATEHLLDLGHERIACICGSQAIYAYHDKVQGYKAALKARQIDLAKELLVEEFEEGQGGGQRAMLKLLDLPEPPTAVFCTDFAMTLGAWHCLSQRGIKVPDQLSLVSYCSGDLNQLSEIPLTTITIGERNIGHAAARLLFDILGKRVVNPLDVSISTNLQLGKSTIALP